jgi:SAM-dependent methyltransferase
MSWQRFDREAERYAAWYATRRGQAAFAAETRLLLDLLAAFPEACTVLEVGCGCGHFTAWLAQQGRFPLALDRAPGMLRCLRRLAPGIPAVQADAHELPLGDRTVDAVVYVTALEFVADLPAALAEAARVARLGIAAIALNRHSLGALARRTIARSTFLREARDFSPHELASLLAAAAGPRFVAARARTALLPRPLPAGPSRLPFGDVIGAAVRLDATDPTDPAHPAHPAHP